MEEHSKKEKKDKIYKGHRNKLEKKKNSAKDSILAYYIP